MLCSVVQRSTTLRADNGVELDKGSLSSSFGAFGLEGVLKSFDGIALGNVSFVAETLICPTISVLSIIGDSTFRNFPGRVPDEGKEESPELFEHITKKKVKTTND